MHKSFAKLILATALAMAITVLVAPGAANAVTETCSGTRIATWTHRSSGTVVAKTGIYEGRNDRICAVTVKQGALYGKSTYMDLRMRRFEGMTEGDTYAIDDGYFRYQAGAITLSATNRCIYISVYMLGTGGAMIVNDDHHDPICR